MIKQLIYKLKNKSSNNKKNKKAFTLNSLYAAEISYYDTKIVKTEYGIDIEYIPLIYIAILIGKSFVHVKSKKTFKELQGAKNSKKCANNIIKLASIDKVQQFMNKYNINENSEFTLEQLIDLEEKLNLAITKRTTLNI